MHLPGPVQTSRPAFRRLSPLMFTVLFILFALLAGVGIFHGHSPYSWATDKGWSLVDTRIGHPTTSPFINPKTAALGPSSSTNGAKPTLISENESFSIKHDPWPPADPERLTNVEELRELVSTTDGYFARDWSLGLGWNNIRFIIDSALLQAKLLHRTLILPSFVYARGCEYDMQVCSDYAVMVNKGDVLGSNEWLGLPIDQQMAWVLPINMMINITHLQLYVIENGWYDPPETVRVDEVVARTEEANISDVEEGGIYRTLKDALLDDQVLLDWDKAQELLGILSDEDLEREVVHTFKPLLGMEYSKAVVDPIRQVTPRKNLRGFKNDFGGRKEEVVLLAGEVHHGRKPGSMRFTSRAALDQFVALVLDDVRRIDAVLALADAMVERMYMFTEGRLWMAAHIRRGDFVRHNLVMERSPKEHMARVKNHLKEGVDFIRALRIGEETLKICDVPVSLQISRENQGYGGFCRVPDPYPAGMDMEILKNKAPLAGDWFYVATDERNKKVLEEFRKEGAVFMDDLLTISDRRNELSWALMFTDFRGLVEQIVLSRAAFFYGHALSSVAGGVMNLRALGGMDPRTADVD
ncbi:uncharacterized protein EV420DRAFT_1749629 [Desarmillaria tabescens]|uniref:O-fucosyltransferase family protein n=1 Tax=Armillaria tabescens TaxID=1929756 RepID=A0AA39K4A6_ARMTA|nr:uncharacterized protein EV420DRAFT_1749629 [Desarmillaria tabescens]KAK0454088.1 hypothetical protein EV420DRAFT_1749629 [Desarmillaria tabescens]